MIFYFSLTWTVYRSVSSGRRWWSLQHQTLLSDVSHVNCCPISSTTNTTTTTTTQTNLLHVLIYSASSSFYQCYPQAFVTFSVIFLHDSAENKHINDQSTRTPCFWWWLAFNSRQHSPDGNFRFSEFQIVST